ncbi:MAG: hypothetical protein HFI68_09520 [Lachnospiraceae bacterium]|nr:hypothetical protein [Lachnospiraceae bacterium]
MDREEVLRRSRNEKNNEMEARIWDRAMRWTYLGMVLAAAVFSYIRSLDGQPVMDLCATVCISVFAGRIYYYIKTKDKFNLIMALFALVIAVFATVRFFMGH